MGEPILSVWTPRSGVTVGNPEFEWRLVARANGFTTFQEWCEIDLEEQRAQIAVYRLEHQIEAVLNKDAVDKQKAAQK